MKKVTRDRCIVLRVQEERWVDSYKHQDFFIWYEDDMTWNQIPNDDVVPHIQECDLLDEETAKDMIEKRTRDEGSMWHKFKNELRVVPIKVTLETK